MRLINLAIGTSVLGLLLLLTGHDQAAAFDLGIASPLFLLCGVRLGMVK